MEPVRITLGDLTATLFLGDCLEIAPQLVGVRHVITDPPYGISYVHSGTPGRGGAGATKAASLRGNDAIIGDAQPFDPTPWLGFENVLMWGADHYYRRLPDSGRLLCWNKLGDLAPWDSFSDVEFAWHSGEGAARIFSMLWKGLACDKRGENGGLREHPTQKPIRLMSWCLDAAKVPVGETVLDPFMGSGTTGLACLRTGRNFTGIEKDPKHFATAVERLEREARQGVLI
jgi:site-specific DNA-methyltransferase (adenine-specific)